MPKAGYDLLKAKKYDPLIAELVDRLGMEATATVWLNAEAWLDLVMASLPDMPPRERQLVEGSVLPCCAIYLAIGASLGKEPSRQLVSDFLRDEAASVAARYRGLLMLPGGRRLALLIAGRLCRRALDASRGFEATVRQASSTCLDFEVRRCPYQRWCVACGAGEVVPLFCARADCANDLAGLRFAREGCLAQGDERCAFVFELK